MSFISIVTGIFAIVKRVRATRVAAIGMGSPFVALVISAKAGIQSVGGAFPCAWGVDSPLRE